MDLCRRQRWRGQDNMQVLCVSVLKHDGTDGTAINGEDDTASIRVLFVSVAGR